MKSVVLIVVGLGLGVAAFLFFDPLGSTGSPRGATCAPDFTLEDGAVFPTNDCPDGSVLTYDAIVLARLMKEATLLSLGDISVESWPFDQCAVMEALASDERWLEDLDSVVAATLLQGILPSADLKPDFAEALVQAGRAIEAVELEVVLLGDATGLCPSEPVNVPRTASVSVLLVSR